MRQGRPRGDFEQVRRRKRSGVFLAGSEGSEGRRESAGARAKRDKGTDRPGAEAHICPAHNRHSQDPPVVERTTHARATRHAANRHGTRAALPTGLMSEHSAVFHGTAGSVAHAERGTRISS